MLAILNTLHKRGIKVAPARKTIKQFKGTNFFRLIDLAKTTHEDVVADYNQLMAVLYAATNNPIVQLVGTDVIREFDVRSHDPVTGEQELSGVFRDRQDDRWTRWLPISECDETIQQGVETVVTLVYNVYKKPVSVGIYHRESNGFIVANAAMLVGLPEASISWLYDRYTKKRVTEEQVIELLAENATEAIQDTLDTSNETPIATGLGASAGCAIGTVAMSSKSPLFESSKPILVVNMTTPEDVDAMKKCSGIITQFGGMSSHAALLARGFGIPCIVGANGVIDTVSEGSTLSMNASDGKIYAGSLPVIKSKSGEKLIKLLSACDKHLQMKVYANADEPDAVVAAIQAGAAGIGLCRTEHMFFGEGRILKMRAMILSQNETQRASFLMELKQYQTADFIQIFKAAEGLPVTIRLLDPPLHEFLPEAKHNDEMSVLVQTLDMDEPQILKAIVALHEQNPMMGHRGCRLGITIPEIYAMQAQAIAEALGKLQNKHKPSIVHIMIPLVSDVREFAAVKAVIDRAIKAVDSTNGDTIHYDVGTMIETPRAALLADDIAEHADFMSIGSNDLTQFTYGFSRDDIGRFLPEYLDLGVLPTDPFAHLDVRGVGRLIHTCVKLARAVKPEMSIGLCGEHGGDPVSVRLCYDLGLSYVSCSVPRIPAAKLASAKASLKGKR